MASVVFYMEDGTTLVHKLENEVTTIGRHPESIVQLTSPSSSGKHAIIKETAGGYYVQDLGSSNGTRVNGAEVEEALLKDGDRVGFGDVQAVFYIAEPPISLEEAPTLAAPRPLPSPSVPPPSAVSASAPQRPAGRPLSPVRRAYSGKVGAYPDTTGSGCMTGIIVMALFFGAFAVGMGLRHSKEMNGNIVKDTLDKVFGEMPKIKIETSEEKKD